MKISPNKLQERSKPKLLEVIACAKCKGNLKEDGTEFFCPSCQERYSMQGGVLRVSENRYYWGEIDQLQSQKLLENARKLGWLEALKNAQKDLGNSIFEYILRANRADWRFNLPLNKHIRVLDIGSGWGQIPFLLAEAYDEVWSLEYIRERIDWQQLRKEQEGVDNLYLVQSNLTRMPFLDGTFDIISMNGVLEWVGLAEKEVPVRNIQLQVLSDVLRMLKIGGHVYVGIENRIGYNMFMGGIDHSGRRFTSLMPRRLADLYVRNSKRDSYRTEESQNSYRTYTYSPSGYRRLLGEAGFSSVELYWVETSYNNPIAFASLNHSRKIDFYYKQIVSRNLLKRFAKMIFRTLVRCGFMRLFSSHLLIYAQKRK